MKDIPHEQLIAMENSSGSVGSMLTEARNARRWERRDVAIRLGVSPGVIEALEEDEFQRLGAPVFVRGYLIRYARLLDLPEQEILDRYKQLGVSDPPPLQVGQSIRPQARMSDTGVRWISYLLFFGMIAYLAWLGLEQVTSHLDSSTTTPQAGRDADGNTVLVLPQLGSSTPEQAGQPLAASSTELPTVSSPTPVTATEGQVVDREEGAGDLSEEDLESSTVTETAPPSTLEDGVGSLPAVEETTAESVAEQPETAAGPESAPAGEPRLVMEFADDCWVDIRDASGERLAYGLMKANTTRSVSGSAPFSLVLGNAGAVSIELNGQPVDKSTYMPARGTVARFSLDVPADQVN